MLPSYQIGSVSCWLQFPPKFCRHSLFPPTYPTFYYPNKNTWLLCVTNLHVKKHTNYPTSSFCHPNVFLSVLFPNTRNACSDANSHKYARNFQTNWNVGLKNWNCVATSAVYITKSHSGTVMCDKNIFSLRHYTGGTPDVINNGKSHNSSWNIIVVVVIRTVDIW
jgi:hypothetical protein